MGFQQLSKTKIRGYNFGAVLNLLQKRSKGRKPPATLVVYRITLLLDQSQFIVRNTAWHAVELVRLVSGL